MDKKDIIEERLKNNQCIICGSSEIIKAQSVIDVKYGEITICGKHFVQGSNKLVKE